ncbi:hypothetical protein Pint_27850 [Pistacia integerrima]|uniref:Uncharacterized protein n=1 Tax=Pistacia integerrima TaxID=434235 RepID=A0ACC0YQT3_9ROSI|nr:hypothetical protein Pint_27850 [Pistacia integerrima]
MLHISKEQETLLPVKLPPLTPRQKQIPVFLISFCCMEKVCWPYFDPDFDNLPDKIYGPTCRVVAIDNESLEESIVVKVDSVNKQQGLLEVVQVLTDLNLSITKGYISSNVGWFMDGHNYNKGDDNRLGHAKDLCQ